MVTPKVVLFLLAFLLATVKTQGNIDPCAYTECMFGYRCEQGNCIPN